MRRREFIGLIGSMAAWPLAARAQQSPGKMWRVAYLHPAFLDTPSDRGLFDSFRAEMRRLGYIEGKNLVIDSRGAEGKTERLPLLAGELIELRPDAIVAIATPAIAAVQRATSGIPVVMCPATDPIGSGFVKSLAHPGGNITGIANMYGDAIGKSVELLHTLLPDAKHIAVLMSSNPTHPRQYELAEAALKTLGLSTVPILAPTPADLEQAFAEMEQEMCDALFVLADPIRPTVVSLAAKMKIPAIFQFSNYVEMGGLASYGANLTQMFRKAAQYVDRIFKGANPAETPVEQPVAFEFILNLKTAKALGLNIPDSVIARADTVIE
jgi:putative ABC transport system substrate-binding protein